MAHGVKTKRFYILDPDGHRIEIFCEMATIASDGSYVDADGNRLGTARADEV